MSEELTCKKCGKVSETPRGSKIHEAKCTFKKAEVSDEGPLHSGKLEKMNLSQMELTKRHLAAQPKVSFHIPLEEGEAEGSYATVQINGYTIQIKKGVMVSLPQQVVEMLAHQQNVQMMAGREMLLNREDKVKEALQ